MYSIFPNVDAIRRDRDNTWFPKDERNELYKEYLLWVEAGNKARIVEPVLEPVAPTLEQRIAELERKINDTSRI